MALSADTQLPFEEGFINELPMTATSTIYEGSAVGKVTASGHCRKLNAGDAFVGFALTQSVNSGAAATKTVRVRHKGRVQLAIGSLAVTDLGKPVYASDENTFTLTATSNSYIGRVVRFVSSGVGVVEFDASKAAIGLVTLLTDSSGGTAADTIAAIGATYNQAEVRNAVASLAAKFNAILQQLA